MVGFYFPSLGCTSYAFPAKLLLPQSTSLLTCLVFSPSPTGEGSEQLIGHLAVIWDQPTTERKPKFFVLSQV